MKRDPERYATTDGKPPAPGLEDAAAPQPIDPATGQHGAYWVLSEAERAKGFVRPVRDRYKHVGTRPSGPLRALTEKEREAYGPSYVAFEEYGPERAPVVGRGWTEAQLKSGCGSVTTMGRALSETYAREPKFYGTTFCCQCRAHFRVEEFVWTQDGQAVGS